MRTTTVTASKGLTKLRWTNNRRLLPPCQNCGHRRYSWCSCLGKGGQKREPPKEQG